MHGETRILPVCRKAWIRGLMRSVENLIAHELIGLRVRAKHATDRKHKPVAGTIVDETENTLVIKTRGGERRLPKKDWKFVFKLNDGKVEVEGWTLVSKPWNRTKHAAKLMRKWRV